MAKHALLSASGAHRWLECTPSALLELQFPQSTSEYAEEGTAAHELCELTARYFLGEVSEMDFENRRDELAKGPYYNAEMQECANDYARFVTEKTKAAQESCEDAFTELEVRVDFSKYVKDGFGTGDCIEHGRIRGMVDELESLRQAIYLILSTERYAYLIYSWNYGVELVELIGQPKEYALPEIKRCITEALLQDDRITAVDGFEFETGKKTVHVTFTVHSIFGDLEVETDV